MLKHDVTADMAKATGHLPGLAARLIPNATATATANFIEVAVRRLRAKMDDPCKPKRIRPGRGMGYVLEAPEQPEQP